MTEHIDAVLAAETLANEMATGDDNNTKDLTQWHDRAKELEQYLWHKLLKQGAYRE